MLTKFGKDFLQQHHIQKAAAFRDFKAQVLRREFHFIKNRQHVIHEVRFFQLRVGQINVHDESRIASNKFLRIRQRRFQNPLTQFREEVVLFQDIYELYRRNHAIFIIFPANQSFGTDNLFAYRIYNGLVAKEEPFTVICNAVADDIDAFNGKALVIAHVVSQHIQFAQVIILGFVIGKAQARIHRFRSHVELFKIDCAGNKRKHHAVSVHGKVVNGIILNALIQILEVIYR